MNLTNLFENTSPSNNYCDQVAEKLPAGLQSDDDILDAAWDIVVKDLGRTVARNKFMDEDFPSDLIGAYKQGVSDQLPQETLDLIDEYIAKIEPEADRGELIKHVVDGSIDTSELEYAVQDDIAEGGPYDLPGIDYPRPGDTPKKPRYRGQSSPGVIPDDEDYFRERFRKKREAAKKAEREQDHDRLATGTNEGKRGNFDDKSVMWHDEQENARVYRRGDAGYDEAKKAKEAQQRRLHKKGNDKMKEGQQWPDSSNSLAKRSAVATNLKGAPSKAGRTSGMTVATRVDPTITSTTVQRKDDRPIPSFLQKGVAEGADDKFSVADKVEELVYQYKLFDKRGWTDLFEKLAGRKLKGEEIYREMEYASKFLQLLDSIRMRSDYRGQQNPKLDQELIDLSNQWISLLNKATSEFKGMGSQGVAEGFDPVESDYGHWEYILEKDGYRDPDVSGARALELVAGDYRGPEGYISTIRNILTYVKQNREVLSKAVADRKTVKDCIMDIKKEYPQYYQAAQQPQAVAEADKKKEDDLGTEVRDVSLQRAIARAKSDFPTAGSGIEALAKDLMRGQEQDKQDFEKIRAVDKDQERMLAQIAQVDQNQTQEIDNLEQDNTTLKRRLQQIQAVNAKLEKTLASMSGRKKEKATPADTSAGSFSPSASIPDAPATDTTPKTKSKNKAQPKTTTTSKAIGQVAKSLAGPSTSPAIDRIAKELQPRQQELGFNDEPVTIKPKKFDTSRATDVVAREPGEVAKDVSKNIGAYGARLSGADRAFNPDAIRNLVAQDEFPMENNKEAKYSDKYQDMVARVGQKAREQEKSKPVDIKDLARRLAAIDAKDKSAR